MMADTQAIAGSSENLPQLQGWLIKQGATKFSAEKRRWFLLDRKRKVLYYFKKPGLPHTSCIGFIDIMLASNIAPTNEKPLEFQIVTPGRTYVLTAPSDSEFVTWVNGLGFFHQAEGLHLATSSSKPDEYRAQALDSAVTALRTQQPAAKRAEPENALDKLMLNLDLSANPEVELESPRKRIAGPPAPYVRDRAGAAGRAGQQRALEVPKSVEALSASGDKIELLSEYSRLQTLYEGAKSELAEKKKQLVVFQEMVITTLKGMEKKQAEGRMDIKKARYEVWLARAQLEEIQKSVIEEKDAHRMQMKCEMQKGKEEARAAWELEYAKEREEREQEAAREKERIERAWAKEKAKWERERQRERDEWVVLARAEIQRLREEWERERQQEREEWAKERHEWFERVAKLTGNQGDDEEEECDDDASSAP